MDMKSLIAREKPLNLAIQVFERLFSTFASLHLFDKDSFETSYCFRHFPVRQILPLVNVAGTTHERRTFPLSFRDSVEQRECGRMKTGQIERLRLVGYISHSV
jgi:hypothetical protein